MIPSDHDYETLGRILDAAEQIKHNACFEVSYAIERELGWAQASGYYMGLGEGIGHYWNRMPDGTIIDATFDQFDPDCGDPVRVVLPDDPGQADYRR